VPRIFPVIRRTVEQAPAGDRDATFPDSLDLGDLLTAELRRDDSLDFADLLEVIRLQPVDTVDLADAQRPVTLTADDDEALVVGDQGFIRTMTVPATEDWYADAAAAGTSHATGVIRVVSDRDISGNSNERRGYFQFDLRNVVIPAFRDRSPDAPTAISLRASNAGIAAQTINYAVLLNATTIFAETATWNSMGQPDDTPGSYVTSLFTGDFSVAAGAADAAVTLPFNTATNIFDAGAAILLALTHPGGLLGTEVTFRDRSGGFAPSMTILL
jgi:hypothetical protein